MYLNKIKNIKLSKFKNRSKSSTFFSKNKFSISNNVNLYKIFCKNTLLLELKYYRFFFLKLRKISKKKKFYSFVFLSCNHCFSKKSKNSRMGKGKGKFIRYVCRKNLLKPIFIFNKISKIRFNKFLNYLNTKSYNLFF